MECCAEGRFCLLAENSLLFRRSIEGIAIDDDSL